MNAYTLEVRRRRTILIIKLLERYGCEKNIIDKVKSYINVKDKAEIEQKNIKNVKLEFEV